MCRNKTAIWLVLFVYLLVGAVELAHVLYGHHEGVTPIARGAGITADHPSRCRIPGHDHSPRHDAQHCQLCQHASLPTANLARSPLIVAITLDSTVAPVRAWTVPVATTPIRLLARGPPAA